MLSYRHAFHAGNHADIFKHTVLSLILKKMSEKEKPFTFFDTHAGAGCYDLDDERALKTGEAQCGIQKLLSLPEDTIPQEMKLYTDLCRAYYSREMYPGSPEIERCLMRKDDALFLCELHNTEIEVLKNNMELAVLYRGIARQNTADSILNFETVHPQIHHRSGYEALIALTPPKIKRGGAVIDPSFEEKSDFSDAAQTIASVHKKWNTGVIMLWYPLLAHRKQEIADMKRILLSAAQSGSVTSQSLCAELLVNTPESHTETSLEDSIGSKTPRLYGSGLFIINPPYKLDEQLTSILPFLAENFGVDGNGSYTIRT